MTKCDKYNKKWGPKKFFSVFLIWLLKKSRALDQQEVTELDFILFTFFMKVIFVVIHHYRWFRSMKELLYLDLVD